jgi:hypothetical protein
MKEANVSDAKVTPLWSDEQIDDVVMYHSYMSVSERQMVDKAFKGADASVMDATEVQIIARSIRNRYETERAALTAELEQLRAQVAALQLVPAPAAVALQANDTFAAFDRACGDELEALCDHLIDTHEAGSEVWVDAQVIRHALSSARAAPVAPPLDVPQPDWSQAPKWAMWWAVDANGYPMWYMHEPFIQDAMWMWQDNDGLASGIPSRHLPQSIELPIGTDWRTTLRQRPQVTP